MCRNDKHFSCIILSIIFVKLRIPNNHDNGTGIYVIFAVALALWWFSGKALKSSKKITDQIEYQKVAPNVLGPLAPSLGLGSSTIREKAFVTSISVSRFFFTIS